MTSILNTRMGSFLVSYLQSLQESEGPKPATTRNQTESGIVQHFPIIIPRTTRGMVSQRKSKRKTGQLRVIDVSIYPAQQPQEMATLPFPHVLRELVAWGEQIGTIKLYKAIRISFANSL